jgi:SacI restriction endonuclease
MPISIDHGTAEAILCREAQEAEAHGVEHPPLAKQWFDRVNRLGALCPPRKSSTVIAALGTALLAKATNKDVDVYSLLDRGTSPHSYSARSLADGVLARNRGRLGIDLGANGVNPLNNTPFIGKTRIDEISGVRNKEGWNYFLECLEDLKRLKTTAQARLALRGFIKARQRSLLAAVDLSPEAGDALGFKQLSSFVASWVAEDSEGGRRAQAAVAALLDVVYPDDMEVVVGVINDPDRRAPLDVSVRREDGSFVLAVEVKDKPVEGHHIRASVERTAQLHSVKNLAFVAVSQRQGQAVFDDEIHWAAKHGFRVTIFLTWESLFQACKAFATEKAGIFEGMVYRQLISRGMEIGLSEQGMAKLRSLAEAIQADQSGHA